MLTSWFWAQGGRLRRCSKLKQPLGVKRTSRSSGLRPGSHLSLELVDSTPSPSLSCPAILSMPRPLASSCRARVICLDSAPGRPRRLRTMPALVVKCPSRENWPVLAIVVRDGAFAMIEICCWLALHLQGRNRCDGRSSLGSPPTSPTQTCLGHKIDQSKARAPLCEAPTVVGQAWELYVTNSPGSLRGAGSQDGNRHADHSGSSA